MAKNQPEDKGKVKFRFVEFELEGLNSTIEESIKSIVHSMNRGSSAPVRIVGTNKPTPQLSSVPAGDNGHAETELETESIEEVDETTEDTKATTAQAGKVRRYTVPTFLKELDLDSGDVPFKKFADERNPQSDNRKYIVIAAWLKKYRNLDVITPDHVFTCNQKMGWKTQRDVGQPFRYMRKKSYFDPSGRNQWTITHVGLDQLTQPEE
jgi:hypothetical protein